jgi:hypothetical protein
MKLMFAFAVTALCVVGRSPAASIVHQVTHEWSTNYLTYVPTVNLPGIPAFNPALGTLTNVSFTLSGERKIVWTAEAPFSSGSYYVAATAQFTLNAPELSSFPSLMLATFATPQQSAGGFLEAGQTASGTLISMTNASGVVTTDLQRFSQTNQFFVLSNYGLDGGYVGYGGGAGFSTLIRYASAVVTITYNYTPVAPPMLTIVPAGPQAVTVSWTPATGTNWVLQEATELAGLWTNSPSGATNPVTVPALPPRKFYRLFKP